MGKPETQNLKFTIMASQNTTVYDTQITHDTSLASGQSMLPLQSQLRVFKVRHTLTSALANTEVIRLGFPRLRNAKLMQTLSRVTVIGASNFSATLTISRVPGDTGTPVALTAAVANANTNVAFGPVSAGSDTSLVGMEDSLIATASSVSTAAIGAVLEFELVFDVPAQP